MKKTLLALLGMGVLTLGSSRAADAAVFLSMQASGVTVSCDTNIAVGGTNCTNAGFILVSATNIIFTGSVDGYTFATVNVSGSQTSGSTFVTDSKTTVANTGAATDLTVDFGGTAFTLPTGPNLTLSASQTANWTTSTAGDAEAFTGWAANGNVTAPFVGTAAATAPIVSPGGTTNPTSSQSPDVAFLRNAATFSLIGREVIHQAVGTNGNYQGTITVSQVSVPEPASMLLLGTGLLGLARRATRKGRKQNA